MCKPLAAPDSPWQVFLIFLRLGLTSFGGPLAHLGYFRQALVVERRWLDEARYAELVALCQFLPGPASSQVGMALGLQRAGYAGALAAWCGFTLPSAVLLIGFALGLQNWSDSLPSGVLQGLKIVTVAVVAQAVWGMGRSLCQGARRASLMVLACLLILLWPSAWNQLVVIGLAALAGMLWLQAPVEAAAAPGSRAAGAGPAWLCLLLFIVLLFGLPLAADSSQWQPLQLVDAFYRAGSLVFGGGHVVLPLLQAEVVPNGWVSNSDFLAGYGAAQAVPGPLFTFAAFLGAVQHGPLNGWSGGLLCLLAVFLPSFLLVAAALPFWDRLRHLALMQAAMAGVGAGVVGLLLAALYQPIWHSAIAGPRELALALLAWLALQYWRLPAWLVVLGCALCGGLFGLGH